MTKVISPKFIAKVRDSRETVKTEWNEDIQLLKAITYLLSCNNYANHFYLVLFNYGNKLPFLHFLTVV